MARKKMKVAWKRNIRKIPNFISLKIQMSDADEFVVACVKKIKQSEIIQKLYSHLNIKFHENKLIYPTRILPKPLMGKYSLINIEGDEIIRKDLPMITKTYVVETPNYGDWYYGSHEVYFDREIYIRDYIAPKLLEIEIELIGEEDKDELYYIFKFTVDEVIDKNEAHFKNELFNNLNIIQENVGNCDVYTSEATLADYLKTIYVFWEILPPDDTEKNISQLISEFKIRSKKHKEKLIQRYNILEGLKPVAFINGTSGFRRYFGAKFSENLVAFENLEYGNAIYVMYENWEELSKKSRIELLTGDNKGFDRIIHSKGWINQLKYLIKNKLEDN